MEIMVTKVTSRSVMSSECVTAADFYLFFGCETAFAQNAILDSPNLAAFL